MNIKWNDWREKKPTEAGHYLVWSQKYGLRLTHEHPSWWNQSGSKAGRYPGIRVRFWVFVSEPGVGIQLRAASRPRAVDPMSCPHCDGITPRGVLEHAPGCPALNR